MDLELCADFLSRAHRAREEEQSRLTREMVLLSADLEIVKVRRITRPAPHVLNRTCHTIRTIFPLDHGASLADSPATNGVARL